MEKIIQKAREFYINIVEMNHNITDSIPLKLKSRFLINTDNNGTVNTDIAVPLWYLTIFWRTLEMFLINCQISLILTCPVLCISKANRAANFPTTDTDL